MTTRFFGKCQLKSVLPHFTNFQGNTDLYFTVELWDASFSTLLDQTSSVSGQPIKADNEVLPDNVTISGYMRYLDLNSVPQPIRYAQVEVVDWDIPALIYPTYTDAGGHYSITIPNDLDGDGTGADIDVRVLSAGSGSANPIPGQTHSMIEVRDPADSELDLVSSPIGAYDNNTQSALSIDLTAPNIDTLDGVFSVYDAGIEAYLRAYEYFGAVMPKLDVRWPDTSTWYDPTPNDVHAVRGDRWDRDVLMHEYGHFIEDVYSFAEGFVGFSNAHWWDKDLRTWGDNRTDEEARILAFREGWANWFSVAVQYAQTGQALFQNVDNNNDIPGSYIYWYELDLESGTGLHLSPGQFYEAMNTCSLWDVYDNNNSVADNNDNLSLGMGKIWEVCQQDHPDEITEFWNRWFFQFPTNGYNRQMTDIFLDHEMTFIAQRPVNPNPMPGSTDVPINPVLSWDSCANATSYDVYLGNFPCPNYCALEATVTQDSIQLTNLDENQEYWWMVVAKDNHAEAESFTWSFTTGACDCPHQGDINGSGAIDPVDLSAEIDIVFFGAVNIQDPTCTATRGNLNADGATDATDLSYMIDIVFFGGQLPNDPCSPSPTATAHQQRVETDRGGRENN